MKIKIYKINMISHHNELNKTGMVILNDDEPKD